MNRDIKWGDLFGPESLLGVVLGTTYLMLSDRRHQYRFRRARDHLVSAGVNRRPPEAAEV